MRDQAHGKPKVSRCIPIACPVYGLREGVIGQGGGDVVGEVGGVVAVGESEVEVERPADHAAGVVGDPEEGVIGRGLAPGGGGEENGGAAEFGPGEAEGAGGAGAVGGPLHTVLIPNKTEESKGGRGGC